MIESTILAYAQSIKKQHYSSINNQNLKKFVKSIFFNKRSDNVKTFKTKKGKKKEKKGTNEKKNHSQSDLISIF